MNALGPNALGPNSLGPNSLIPERFERGRLRYERIGLGHSSQLEAVLLDPRVYRTLDPWPPPPTARDVRAHAQAKHDHWERYGFGPWLIRERTSGDVIGRGGLQHTDAVGGEPVEVAWAVAADRWGEGFATELAHTAIEFGFGALELEELIAFTLHDNVASRRVMEKSAFTYSRDIEHDGLPHVLYTRLRPTPVLGSDTQT